MSVVNAKCPNCGASIQIDNERTEGFCSYCGSKVKVEEAQKLLIQGTVKVDTSDELENLLVLARRAKKSRNYKKAYQYYEKILKSNPNSWEAIFYTICSNAHRDFDDVDEQEGVYHELGSNLSLILDLIKSNEDEKLHPSILREIWEEIVSLYFHKLSTDDNIGIEFADLVESKFSQECESIIVKVYKKCLREYIALNFYTEDEKEKEYILKYVEEQNKKIRKYDPNHKDIIANVKTPSTIDKIFWFFTNEDVCTVMGLIVFIIFLVWACN